MERGVLLTRVDALIGGLWGRGELHLVDAVLAPHVRDHMPIPGQLGGRAAMRDVVRLFRDALPDLRMDLKLALAAGDGAAGWTVDVWELSGTHAGPLFGVPPTGREVRFCGIDVARHEPRGITDLWHVEELGRLGAQVGYPGLFPFPERVVPADAPAMGMAGPPALAATARQHSQVWGRGDGFAALACYHPDVEDHTPAPGQAAGLAGVLECHATLRASFPDLAMTRLAAVFDPPHAAIVWRATGTHTGAPFRELPARGRPFAVHGIDVLRVDPAGQVTDLWHVEELAQLRAQIG